MEKENISRWVEQIAKELSLQVKHVIAVTTLLQEGATIPFISRYRKELTGSMDEVAVAAVKDRLEQLQELDARRLVDGARAEAIVDRLHHPVGSRVTIAEGVFEQGAALAEQGVVAAPRVDGDAVERRPGHPVEAALHLQPQPGHIPMQLTGVTHRFVGEATELGEIQDAAGELPEDGASALRP